MSFPAHIVVLLRAWWNSFTPDERSRFEATFGSIYALLSVTLNEGFLPAISKFWHPALSLFRFGVNELTPTLEEYQFLLAMEPGLNTPVQLPPRRGKKPRLVLSELIGLRKSSIEVENVDGIPTVRIDFLLSLYGSRQLYNPNATQYISYANDSITSFWRINALAFVLIAGLFFPRDHGLLDMRVASYVEAVRNHHTIIPAILAETYRSLTALQCKQTHVLCGAELLFAWIVAHLFRTHSARLSWFRGNRLVKLLDGQKNVGTLPHGRLRWEEALDNVTPDTVVWNLGAFSATEFPVSLRSEVLSFLPLVGLSSVVPYFAGRVMRLFGINQDIPITDPRELSENYRFEFSTNHIPSEVGEALAYWYNRYCFSPDRIYLEPGVFPRYQSWIEEIVAAERNIGIPVSPARWVGPTDVEAYIHHIESQASTFTLLTMECRAINRRHSQERDDAVQAREEAQQALAAVEFERDTARIGLDCAEQQFAELKEKILTYEERIDILQAALNGARASTSSTSTLSNLEDSLSRVTTERDALTQEMAFLHSDLDASKAASEMWQRQFNEISREWDVLRDENMNMRSENENRRGERENHESRIHHLESLLMTERQQIDQDRGYYMRTIDQLRMGLTFTASLYPGGQFDVARVESLLGRVQYLRDLEVARILSTEELFDRYRDTLSCFHEFLDSLLRGGRHP